MLVNLCHSCDHCRICTGGYGLRRDRPELGLSGEVREGMRGGKGKEAEEVEVEE